MSPRRPDGPRREDSTARRQVASWATRAAPIAHRQRGSQLQRRIEGHKALPEATGCEVWVVDLVVETDNEFEFADRSVEISMRAVDHGDVVRGRCFASTVVDLGER